MAIYEIKFWTVDSIKAEGRENARSAYKATLQWSNKSGDANHPRSIKNSKLSITFPREQRTEQIPLIGTFWTHNGEDPTLKLPYHVTLSADDDDLYVYLSFILSFRNVAGESGGSSYNDRWSIAGQALFENKKASDSKREVYYLTGISAATTEDEYGS